MEACGACFQERTEEQGERMSTSDLFEEFSCRGRRGNGMIVEGDMF